MKKSAAFAICALAAVSAFAWEHVNTNSNYFVDESTTISEDLAPYRKNIHINDQGNFAAGEEAKWKLSDPTTVIVAENVNVTSKVYNYFKETEVDGTFGIGKTKLTFMGNNTITAGDMILTDAAEVYANNATFNLSGDNALRFAGENCKAVFNGGVVNANRVYVQSNTGSLTFNGTKVSANAVSTSGAMSGITAKDFTLTLKGNSTLTLTDSSIKYGNYSANSQFHGKIIVQDGSKIESTNSKYKLFTASDITVSGANSAITTAAVLSKSTITLADGAKISSSTVSANDIVVGANSQLQSSEISAANSLTVNATSTVLASNINFNKLTIAFNEDFASGEESTFDLSDIFGASTSVALSALENANAFTVMGTNGEWSLAATNVGEDGTVSFTIGAQVPEPASVAAIFGALALGLAMYRRRK